MYWLLEKQGKLYFLQSSQTKGRGVLAAFATLVYQRNCVFLCKGTKLKIVCRFFVAQSFAFASGNSCFTNSRVQKLQKALLFAIVCRFFVAQSFAFAVFATLVCLINSVFPCKDTKAQEFGIRRILGLYAGFLFYQRRVPKLQKAALFAIVCRFSPWNVFPPMKSAVWGFGLGLLGGQGFIGAKASLDPLCRFFVAQSFLWHRAFVLAAFATLVCQRNCVFLCKGTKLQNSAKPNSGTVRRFPVLPTPCAKTPDSLPVFALECFSANETGVLISEFSAS